MVADFRSAGSIGSGTGNFSGLGMPTGTADGDVVVIAFESDIEVTAPSGWEELGRFNQTAGSPTVAHAWARRVSGGITAPTITNPGWDHWIARSVAVRDVSTAGTIASNVLAATGGEATADTSVSFPAGGTPTEGNTLWMYILTMGTDQGANNTTRFTGAFSNSGLTGLAERVDNGRADGNGGVLGVWTGRRLQASNPGATTGTSADSDTKAMITLAFYTAPASELPFDTLAQNGSSTTDTTVYTTAGSMNPEANNRMVAYILGSGTAVAAPTLSGLGLTWGLVETEEVPDASTTQKLFVYIAEGVASPTVGTVSITFGATATGCSWHFERVRGAASGTPVQKPKAATSTTPANLTLTWAAAGNAANRQLFGYAVSPQSTGNTVTPEAPWLEESEIVRATPNLKLGVWKNLSTFDTSTTVADDSTYDYCAIGLEFDLTAGGVTGVVDSDAAAAQAEASAAASTSGTVVSDSPAATVDSTAAASTSAVVDSDAPPAASATSVDAAAAATTDSDSPPASMVVSGAASASGVAASAAAAATVEMAGEAVTPVTGTLTSDTAPAQVTAAAVAASSGTVENAAAAAVYDADGVAAGSGVVQVGSGPGTAQIAAQASTVSTLDGVTPAASATVTGVAEADGVVDSVAGPGSFTAGSPADFVTGTLTSESVPAAAAVTGDASAGAVVDQDPPAGSATTSAAASTDGVVTTAAGPGQVQVEETSTATGILTAATGPAVVGYVGAAASAGAAAITAAAGAVDMGAAAASTGVLVSAAPPGVFAATQQQPVVVSYTPGEPYVQTTPGEPYVEVGVFGWGQGGWGEGPWGGTP